MISINKVVAFVDSYCFQRANLQTIRSSSLPTNTGLVGEVVICYLYVLVPSLSPRPASLEGCLEVQSYLSRSVTRPEEVSALSSAWMVRSRRSSSCHV